MENKKNDYSEIKEMNKWDVKEIYRGESDILYKEGEFFAHSKDREALKKFNAKIDRETEIYPEDDNETRTKKKDKSKQKFNLNIPVFPWYGNPLTAKVIVLSLNPACNERQDKISQIIQKLPIPAKDGFLNHLRKMLTFEVDGFLPPDDKNEGSVTARDLANLHQSWYWENRFKKAFPDIDFEEINKKFAVIEYIPYSSEVEPKGFKEELESQKYTKELIRWIYENSNSLFIVARCKKKWISLLSEIKDIENDDRFIFPAPNRCQSLSEKTLKKDYIRVKEAFES